MDHLVELVDTNVFQNQVNLNDPDSHSCKFNDFFDTPNVYLYTYLNNNSFNQFSIFTYRISSYSLRP